MAWPWACCRARRRGRTVIRLPCACVCQLSNVPHQCHVSLGELALLPTDFLRAFLAGWRTAQSRHAVCHTRPCHPSVHRWLTLAPSEEMASRILSSVTDRVSNTLLPRALWLLCACASACSFQFYDVRSDALAVLRDLSRCSRPAVRWPSAGHRYNT